jgi:hypothetical protein
MELGSITMFPQKQDSEWKTATKDHQCQGHPKTKLLLEKSYLLYSGTPKVLCSPTLATMNAEYYTKMLKISKNTSREREQKMILSCFNNTMPAITHMPPQPMPLYGWGLQCYHIQPPAQILILVISTCSPSEGRPQRPKLQF